MLVIIQIDELRNIQQLLRFTILRYNASLLIERYCVQLEENSAETGPSVCGWRHLLNDSLEARMLTLKFSWIWFPTKSTYEAHIVLIRKQSKTIKRTKIFYIIAYMK